MATLEKLEREVSQLTPEQLRDFRAWFIEHDAAAWDRQFERDAAIGKLDDLAQQALDDVDQGRDRPL